jgi:chemotaxis response regulator CheB
MVAGLSSKEDRLAAVEAGANDFITKPIDRIELRVRMASLLTLKHIMVKHSLPVIMVSSATTDGATTTFDALRFGAIDVVAKPSRLDGETVESQKETIVKKVKRSAAVWTGPVRYHKSPATAAAIRSVPGPRPDRTTRFIGIGAGTGCYHSLLRVVP